ncbi:MAG: caspase family protein [candidate division NC10 bacterium]|nr:caspase family protein [candidate division NC10 bacterium]
MRAGTLSINGREIQIKEVDAKAHKLVFLGDKYPLRAGLNYLERRMDGAKSAAIFWSENKKLQAFQIPYRKSYAIIAAIDDYDRHEKPEMDPTGYRPLSKMVDRAKDLVVALKQSGFPEENIFTFYDKDATSDALETELKKFWEGGRYATPDRLIFYFGGHGDRSETSGAGYLVTYNFEKQKPTITALLMNDLTGRQFENITARHMLVLLDACSAGLALPTFQGREEDEEQLKKFQALSIVRRDTEQKARNVLVAGTGEQKALWENGGVFTQALIEGLQGAADLDQNGVIQFDELAVFVRNRVTTRAAQTGVRQDPHGFQATRYGTGNTLFLVPR